MKKHKTSLKFDKWMEQIINQYGDFETTKEKPNGQLSKLNGLGDSTSQKMKILENTGMQEKYKSLVVEDIYPIGELTPAEVVFIEYCLEEINVDLEYEAKTKFILSTKQLLCLLTGIMREHAIFFGNGKESEKK